MNKALSITFALAFAAAAHSLPSDAVQIGKGVLTVHAAATKQADIDFATPGKQVNVGVYYSRIRDARGILVFALTPAGVARERLYRAADKPEQAEIDYDSLECDFADGRAIVRGYKQSEPDGSFLPHVWATPNPAKGKTVVQSTMYFPGGFTPRGTGKKLEAGIDIPAGEGNEDRFFNSPYLRQRGYPKAPGFPPTLPYEVRTSFRVSSFLGESWWEDIGWPGEVFYIETTDQNLERYSAQVATGGDPLWLQRTWILGATNELEFRQIQGYFILDGELYLYGEATGGMDLWGNAIDPRPAYMVIDWDFANGPVNRMIVVDKA